MNEQENWTPGEWLVAPGATPAVYALDNGQNRMWAPVHCNPKGGALPGEAQACAQLIKAAPELARILQDFYALYTEGYLKGADLAVERVAREAYAVLARLGK